MYNFFINIHKISIKIQNINKKSNLMLLERVEKLFSTRYRLLRKILNFVFLRTLLYDGTACSQKTKNAKNAVSSILTAFFKLHRQHFVLPPPLA